MKTFSTSTLSSPAYLQPLSLKVIFRNSNNGNAGELFRESRYFLSGLFHELWLLDQVSRADTRNGGDEMSDCLLPDLLQIALVLSEIGKPLVKTSLPIPEPQENELLIQITAAGRDFPSDPPSFPLLF
jgi:hypothetical protein